MSKREVDKTTDAKEHECKDRGMVEALETPGTLAKAIASPSNPLKAFPQLSKVHLTLIC